MAGRLTPLSQNDFSGGVNAVSNPYLIGQRQSARITNLTLQEQGAMSTRDGYIVLTTSPDRDHKLVYIDTLIKNSGSTFDYAIQQTGTVNRLYRTDTTPWTTVGDFSTQEITPYAVSVVDKDFIANGYETPRLYDGTTLTAITAAVGQTAPPGAKHCAFHLGTLWVWNTRASTTALDGPSSLRASDTNDPNSWPNTNQTFIAKDDGQVGMGMASFTIAEFGISPTQTLVLFKNYNTYQVTGVFGASNFSVQQVKSDMGCIAPRTVQFVSGYGIIRLTHKGFALFNGVDDKLISEEIRPFIFGNQDIPSLNMGAVDQSWAVQSQNPPLYVCACPVVGAGLVRVFVFDLIRRAWTFIEYPENLSAITLVQNRIAVNPTIKSGTTTGRILRLFGGDTDDAGAPIEWNFRTRNYTIGSQLTPAYWRRMILDLVFDPTQTVNFETTLFGAAGSTTNTRTFSGVGVGAKWGQAIWGSFRWGGSSLVETTRDIDILQKANSIRFDISGSGSVRVRGLEVHGKDTPLSGVRINV